jgi:hypothetical protein
MNSPTTLYRPAVSSGRGACACRERNATTETKGESTSGPGFVIE